MKVAIVLVSLLATGLAADIWCAYEDSYLGGYSYGQYSYSTLTEAQDACIRRSSCGGITDEPYNGGRYTLRKGPAVRVGQSPSGETSWTICKVKNNVVLESYKWCVYEDSYLGGYSSGRYTLRRGPSVQQGQSPTGEVSWVQC